MSEEKLYVSEKDVVVVLEGTGINATFSAGEPRPLRESMVDAAKAVGVKEVTAKKPAAKKPAAKATETGE